MAVIREDVVQIGFDIENNPFAQLTAQIQSFQQSVTSGVCGANDELSQLSRNANAAGASVNHLTRMASNVGDLNTNELTESVRETQRTAQNTTRTFTEMARHVRDVARTRIGNSFNRLRTIPQRAVTQWQNLRTRMASLSTINFRTIGHSLNVGVGRAITSAINGARTLLTGLRNVARVTFNAAVNGLRQMAVYAGKASLALGKGVLKASKAVVKSIGIATVAVGGLVAKAVSAYADTEQLVGGVETLFGAKGATSVEEYAKSVGKSVDSVKGEYKKLMDAQNTVITNANNAYATAGMSANDYMDTVTSFSASLISSLGGDTQKAADLANQAIIDMSDNANKMGTDMDSIVETYKSLAKGNYAMLDNLKLGYGGTKGEAQRLVADAAKIDKSINANSLSYANLVKAIHVVQNEMGITGTTAKEANETISGSLSAVKAAWGNMLPALVQGGDAFDQCVANLVSTVSTFGKNVMPAIKSALGGVADLVKELAPMIAKEIPSLVDDILPPMISAATSVVSGLMSALPNLVNNLVKALPSLVNSFMGVFGSVVQGLISAISSNVGNIANMAVTLVTGFINVMLSALPQIYIVAVQLVVALVQGISQQLPQIIPMVVNAITGLANSLVGMIPQIITAGMQLLQGLVEGVMAAIPQLMAAAPQIITTIINSIIGYLPQLVQLALQLINTLVDGLLTNLPVIINGAIQMITALVQGLLQNIPMLISAAINLINGLITGLLQQLPLLIQSAIQLVMSLVDGLIQNIPMLVQAAVQLVVGLVGGLLQNIPLLIQGAIQLIVALVGGLIQAIPQIIAAIPQIVGAIIDGLTSVDWVQVGKDIIGSVWDGVKSLFGKGKESGTNAANSVSSGITASTGTATTAASTLANSTTNSMQLNTTQISGYGTQATTSLANGITANTGTATTAASNLANSTANSLNSAQNTSQIGASAANNLAGGITANTGTATAAASNMSTQVSNAAKTDVDVKINVDADNLSGIKKQVATMVKDSATSLKLLPKAVTQTMAEVNTSTTAGMARMKLSFSQGLSQCKNLTTASMAAIKATVSSTNLYDSGVYIMQGLNRGMNSMKASVMSTARNIAKSVSNTINKELDIHSPSRVTMASGEYTAQGLAIGMQNMKDTVAVSAQGVSDVASGNITPDLGNYTPSNSTTTTNTSNSVYNFNPQFTLNMNGASATDSNKRKVQKWVKESIQETFASMGRIEPELSEV